MVAFIEPQNLVNFIQEGMREIQTKLKVVTDPDEKLALRQELSKLRKQLKQARDL